MEDDDPATADEFDDGSVDVFALVAPDVGALRHIRIGHDSTDGWFLRKVTIERRDDEGKGVWHFPCYRWLDPDKDDLCPYRTIAPSVPEEFKVGNATQLAVLPKYTDGAYDSSLCLPHHHTEAAMYDALSRRPRPRTFVETLIRQSNPMASETEIEQVSLFLSILLSLYIRLALLAALPPCCLS